MSSKLLFALASAAAAATAVAPAQAQTVRYDFKDFDNSVFSYGIGRTGNDAGFTAVTGRATGCFGVSITCTTGGFPVIGINTGSSTASFQTVDVPVGTLLFHPSSDTSGNGDAILAFTAPTAGVYNFSGTFSRLDRVPTGGNGVNVIFATTGALTSSNTIPQGGQGSGFFFSREYTLAANQRVYLGVNNNGEYSYDATGLTGAVSAVPEPATWGMMILGFGMIGLGLRRRKAGVRTTVRFA